MFKSRLPFSSAFGPTRRPARGTPAAVGNACLFFSILMREFFLQKWTVSIDCFVELTPCLRDDLCLVSRSHHKAGCG